MTCSRCKEAYASGKPDSFESEPECAFKLSPPDVLAEQIGFDSSNWQCQTMNELREMADDDVTVWNDDQWATIIAVPYPRDDTERAAHMALGGWDFIVLGWYKDRGRTEAAYMLKESTMAPLTLAVAEYVLEKM